MKKRVPFLRWQDRSTKQKANKREQLLACHLNSLVDALDEYPVGMLVDVSDKHGRKVALACGLSREDIEWIIEESGPGFIPAVHLAIAWEMAEVVLPPSSPTAAKNLFDCKQQCLMNPDRRLVVAISDGGNAYRVVERPSTEIREGQHRHKPPS